MISQREKLLVLITLIVVITAHKEEPNEYEAESVQHIKHEHDQLPLKVSREPSNKVKRMGSHDNESPEPRSLAYESESFAHTNYENNQTPAEDRNGWQVKPKVKRVTKGGKKVHIYLKNDDTKSSKSKRPQHSTLTSTASSSKPLDGDIFINPETQTRRTPELTTKSDRDVRIVRFTDSEHAGSAGSHGKQTVVHPKDSQSDGSEHFDHVVKEKIKIKHHHHHHHHNHVKTVVKKEPYPVEKVIHVPVEKIVEKKVPYKVEVPVDRIVEKIVHVPKPYPFKVEVPYEKIVHVPFEKIVEKLIKVPYDR